MSVRLRKTIAPILLLALSSFAALCVAEAVLRFSAHRLLRGGEWLAMGQIFKKVDPPVGFSLEPLSHQILVSGGAYTSRADINSMGMRDVEHTVAKPPGTRRILVLGDSFMFGQGVEMEESMPRRLAALLPGVETINTGTPGYDLGQEYLLYTDSGHRFSPDVVMLGFFINDLSPAREMDVLDGPDGLPSSYQRKAEMLRKDREEAPGAVSGWLRSHSVLYVLARNRLSRLTTTSRAPTAGSREARVADTPYLPVFLREPEGTIEQDWIRSHRILDELKRRVEAVGSRFAVFLIPAPWQISETEWSKWVDWLQIDPGSVSRRRPQEMISAWCERTATPCLDLLEAFENGDRETLYFPFDMHWTAAGHDLAARAVAEFLTDQRLL